MKNKVYNLIIVDESGSMGHLREATLSGWDVLGLKKMEAGR